jgi:TonB family protein
MPTNIDDPAVDFLSIQQLSDTGLWQSLGVNLRDFFAPQKLPPLQLSSTPVRVREIWGAYDNRKKGAAWSAAVHAVMIAAIFGASTLMLKQAKMAVESPKQAVDLIMPSDLLLSVSEKKKATLAGGGGGGDRDKLEAPKGKLPKFAMEQLTPPAMVIRNQRPQLAIEPTVVMPPDVKLPLAANLPNLGDPFSKIVSGPPSNGTGSKGGIGTGSEGGVGPGEGPGVGPGSRGGFGGGVFTVGGGVSAPTIITQPDPQYSEEARRAKYQGTCILWLIVGPDGRPHDVKVARTLGMGLDEKAVEAVRKWTFEPAKRNGQPVAVQINVQVDFRLF